MPAVYVNEQNLVCRRDWWSKAAHKVVRGEGVAGTAK